MLMPFYGRHDSSLQLGKQMSWSEEVKSEVWTTIIAQKILNQSCYLGACSILKNPNPLWTYIMDWNYLIQAIAKGTQQGFISILYLK